MTLNMGKSDRNAELECVYPGECAGGLLQILPAGTIDCGGEKTAPNRITAV
jgi:hypothetical protein